MAYNPFIQNPDGSKRATGHSSYTWTDENGNVQHAENQAEKNAFTQRLRDNRLRQDLGRYDQYANPYAAQLQRQFGQQVQYGIGQSTGGLMANINQFLTRRGIDPRRGGIAASLQAQQLGGLQQQGAQAQMNFSQRLYQEMNANRNAVLTGELSFFQTLDRMNYQNELNKDLARFQQELQRDNQRWGALGSVIGLGGQVLGGLFGGGGMSDLNYNAQMNNMMQATPQPDANMQPVYF